MAHGIATGDVIASIRASVDAEMAAGLVFAQNGTDPSPEFVTRDVYTTGAVS